MRPESLSYQDMLDALDGLIGTQRISAEESDWISLQTQFFGLGGQLLDFQKKTITQLYQRNFPNGINQIATSPIIEKRTQARRCTDAHYGTLRTL
jgi:hypothetical protein